MPQAGCLAAQSRGYRRPNWSGGAMLLLVPVLAMPLVGLANPLTGGTAAQGPSPFDNAIVLLNDARVRFTAVRDYQCRLVKRERINGTLLPESVMAMKVRNQPYSVYLYCEKPESERGMEVCYVEGRNRGMMRVHPARILGLLGFWSVDLRDPRVFRTNRHCITEAGLGYLLEGTARYWDMERRLNKTLVHIADEDLNGRACHRIETVHPDRTAANFYGYRCVLWLDKLTRLPAGAETYDWPRPGSAGDGELLESYRFENLQCNVGLDEHAFSRGF